MPEYIYYKIICKNENIKDCYVGKTKNFKNRIIEHKSDCYNEKKRNYNLKVYQYIRENGGINNWNFIEIEKGEYDNKDSAFRERYWFENLNATLNSLIPSRTLQESKKAYRENNKERTKKSQKDYRENHREIIKEKLKEKIICECGCDIVKRNLSRHLKTKKHIKFLALTADII